MNDKVDNHLITVVADRKKYHISIAEIICIESMYEYLCYHTKKGKIMSLGSLKDIAIKLPKQNFVRINYSYIINLNHLENYSATTAEMVDGKILKIGRVYKIQFKDLVQTNLPR